MLPSGLIQIDGRQLRAARALLGWKQEDLSRKAKVALGTIKRMERVEGPVRARTDTLHQIVQTLERAGIEFLDEEGPGVRLRKRPR